MLFEREKRKYNAMHRPVCSGCRVAPGKHRTISEQYWPSLCPLRLALIAEMFRKSPQPFAG
uniref:Uncharacterized protein n=1 Tax=Sym plasmid TaxID=28430 RepID=A0A515HJC2_9ZZZZ|nr:hypothetical protein pTL9_00013 [Sym plasmid]